MTSSWQWDPRADQVTPHTLDTIVVLLSFGSCGALFTVLYYFVGDGVQQSATLPGQENILDPLLPWRVLTIPLDEDELL